jgi:Protein of unknown function (DUF4058)
MPIHDWTRVDIRIYHSFHLGWVCDIARALNGGLLSHEYYALSETIIGDPEAGYLYAVRAVAVRHVSDHRLVAMVEIVSPESKNEVNRLSAFVRNKREALAAGVHLLLIDLFPPSRVNPHGIHSAAWGDNCGEDFAQPANKPLTCVAYVGGTGMEAYLEPIAVGDVLLEMPLFLAPQVNVAVPLEATYQSAWPAMPAFWRDVLTGAGSS